MNNPVFQWGNPYGKTYVYINGCFCMQTNSQKMTKSISLQIFLNMNNCIIDRIYCGTVMTIVKISNDVMVFQDFINPTTRDEDC